MDLRDIAKKYVGLGLCALPASPATKYPTVNRWKTYQTRRMSEPQINANFADCEGVCIVCGAVSDGLEMIDFDQAGIAFEPWAAMVEARFPGLLAKMVIERSPSGGRHVYYRVDKASDNETLARSLDKKKLIETRGEGGLVLCDPTPGYTITSGSFESIPQIGEQAKNALWEIAKTFNEYIEAKPAPRLKRAATRADDFLDKRIVSYLASCPPAVSGQGGHARTFAVARAIIWGFDVSAEVGFDYLASDYNPRCLPEWSEGELRHKCQDADTKPFGKPRGYLRDEENPFWNEDEFNPVDLSNFNMTPSYVVKEDGEIVEPAETQVNHVGFKDPGPFPDHLLNVPGFIGEVMKLNLLTAHRKQPVLALAGAIALQAVLAGRKVRDYRNNRTNLYIIGVSDSGTGKDQARKLNSEILLHGGWEELEGPEEVASDAGLVNNLEGRPCMLMQLDEFGKFLRILSNPSKAPHLYSVIGVLLKLYSSASRVYQGKAYAEVERNKKIDQPNLVLYGTGVPSDFFESLSTSSLQDGLVARMLVFEGSNAVVREKPESVKIPQSILDTVAHWRDYQPEGRCNLAQLHPDPKELETTDEAHAVFDALGLRMDARIADQHADWEKSVWSRTEEKACRLAITYACSANPKEPIIDADAAYWACAVSEYMAHRLVYLGGAYVSDNPFDAMQKKVLNKVRASGGQVTQRNFGRMFQHWDKDTRAKVLANMIETHQLVRFVSKKTKPGMHYALPEVAAAEEGEETKDSSVSVRSQHDESFQCNGLQPHIL